MACRSQKSIWQRKLPAMKILLSGCFGVAFALASTSTRAEMPEYIMKLGKLSLANAP
jgi:hypothetical protein